MIKILSWNIQAGGGSRVRKIIHRIISSKAQIVVLSEFRNNATGMIIRNGLLKAGYRYQAVTHSESNDNSVIIVSIIPFSSKLFPNADPNFSGNILSAEFSAFNLMGVYMPHKKKHVLFEYAHDEITKSSVPYILAGDFNSGINYVDQKGNSFWYTDQLAKLKRIGMIDAFRLLHGDVREYSWFSHQKNGYRYDHTYIDKVLSPLVQKCYYAHNWREEKLSDHSPMFLELG